MINHKILWRKTLRDKAIRYDLNKGQYLQGLLARDNNEQRIYVVTIEPEVEDAQIHNRWPRVVQNGENINFISNQV
ncbi:MAG: hypothetical protein COB23_09495 [Methylophaga sp.]|nr:MAG: hypothetical protein COB23_09495 [Methylophaga sp.]